MRIYHSPFIFDSINNDRNIPFCGPPTRITAFSMIRVCVAIILIEI